MLALFRLVELASGTIDIDGIDISKIGLSDLRKKLSIIPQDPQLYTGTIRFNLDPFNESNDSDIWKALEACNMKQAIEKLQGRLDSEVMEGGDNFSVGQKQREMTKRFAKFALLKCLFVWFFFFFF